MSLLLLFQGSGPVTHATSGALVGPGSVVDGTARRFRAHATSGALAGQGSVVDGAATRFRAHHSSGVLAGPGSTVEGSAARTRQHQTSGELVGPVSLLAGAASRSVVAPTGGGGARHFSSWGDEPKKKRVPVEVAQIQEEIKATKALKREVEMPYLGQLPENRQSILVALNEQIKLLEKRKRIALALHRRQRRMRLIALAMMN